MIGRVRHLERYGVATELEPGRWSLSDRAEQVLKDMDHRNEAINSIHRALARNVSPRSAVSPIRPSRRRFRREDRRPGPGQRPCRGRDERTGPSHRRRHRWPRPSHGVQGSDRIEEIGLDMIVEAPQSSPVQDLPTATSPPMPWRMTASIARADTWSASATALSGRARTLRLSCVPTSAAWRHCAGEALSSGSMPIIGRCRRTSWREGKPTTSVRAGRLKNTDALDHRPRSADCQRRCDLARPADDRR